MELDSHEQERVKPPTGERSRSDRLDQSWVEDLLKLPTEEIFRRVLEDKLEGPEEAVEEQPPRERETQPHPTAAAPPISPPIPEPDGLSPTAPGVADRLAPAEGSPALAESHAPAWDRVRTEGRFPLEKEKNDAHILFNRFLAALVDLTAASAAGTVFAFGANRLLESSFTSLQFLRLAVLCALAFFFFSTVFYLSATGQTPGMLWRALKVSAVDRDHASFREILLHTCLFFPVALTLVGLMWAFFDPLHRCWHDRLSGTRVIPVGRGRAG